MEHIIKLPDLASLTPFTWLGCNPRYSRSSRESTDWMLSYGALSGEKRARVVRTNADLLGAYTVPYADPKGLRLTTDHLVLLYVIDELTDDQSDEDASAARDTFTKALTADEVDASPVALATKEYVLSCSPVVPFACSHKCMLSALWSALQAHQRHLLRVS